MCRPILHRSNIRVTRVDGSKISKAVSVDYLDSPEKSSFSAFTVIVRHFLLFHSFIHSFILNIYIAPLQENYSEALPTPARLKRAVLS